MRSALFRDLPIRSQFPDYFQIIKEPLSLNQVRSRIQSGKYEQLSNFMADLAIVFTNARKYNDPLSQIYFDSEEMEFLAEQELEIWQDDWRYQQALAHYEAQLPPKPKRAASAS